MIVVAVAACVGATVRYAYAQLSTWGSYVLFAHDLRKLSSTSPSGIESNIVFDAPYRGATFSLVVPVDSSYLAAARRVDGSALFGFNRSVRAAALRALAEEQRTDPFVNALASRLRMLRAQLRLSDDDYVDLMVRSVQAIPYGTLHRDTFMPAITLADNAGVCSDKSVLLATLLAHEGFDSGVWVFPSQAHAAVALRGTGPGLRGSGYGLVETTRLTYVGEVDESLRAAGPVCEEPQLIVLGGRERYTRDLQTEFIADTLERARGPRQLIPLPGQDEVAGVAPEIGATEPAGNTSQASLAAWIDSRRDWPESTFAALVATGLDH